MKAIPEKARAAMRGSPWVVKVWEMMRILRREREERARVSGVVRVEGVVILFVDKWYGLWNYILPVSAS